MKNKYEKTRMEWINFLERFCGNQIDIKFSKTETDYTNYLVENILDTNISFSNQYGFLTVSFEDDKNKKRFLELINIIFPIQNNEANNFAHNNFKEIYPCRIFTSNRLMVNFYDIKNLEADKIIINRVIVFQNIFNEVIRMKIENINLKLM